MKNTLMKIDKDSIKRIKELGSSIVCDALVGLGLPAQALSKEIQPLEKHFACCGTAFTIRGKQNVTDEEKEVSRDMMENISEGHVIVIDTLKSDNIAHWGELMSVSAKVRGAVGTIVDGGCRDLNEIEEMNYPTFAKYSIPCESANLYCMHEHNIKIEMPGALSELVCISPGDVVLADRDGVVVIPQEVVAECLKVGEGIKEREAQTRKELEQGENVNAAFIRNNVL